MTLQNRFFLAATLTLGMTVSALAQAANGSIHGEVLDPSGALIPQAQVTVTNTDGFSQTLQSSSEGTFEVPNLAPGSYSVSVDAKGFTPALEGGIKVAADKVTDESIKLGISVEQEIEVTPDVK